MGLAFLHDATWLDEGGIPHVIEVKIISGQLCDPITDLILESCDKAILITTEGMGY